MTITDYRKKKISERADYLSVVFASADVTDLAAIAANEQLPVHFDHYEDSFDGMLVHDGSQFHIHINLDKGNSPTSKRGRFSLAHEYGHYFISEHRIGLKYGLLEPHGSVNSLNHETLIELEANYFASCLLMPFAKYKAFAARKDFSFDLINSISDHFQTSLMATILRFIEAGTREFMVVISKKSLVRWYAKSNDFPGFAFKFKVGQAVPVKTLTANFFSQTDPPIQSLVLDRDPEDWFWINDSRGNRTFYEQYYYSDINDYLVTLLWFK